MLYYTYIKVNVQCQFFNKGTANIWSYSISCQGVCFKVYCFSLTIPLSSLPLPGELGWKNGENIRANTGTYLRQSLYSMHMLPALQGLFFHLFLQTWASKILKNRFINILRKTIITSSERWCVKRLPPKNDVKIWEELEVEAEEQK